MKFQILLLSSLIFTVSSIQADKFETTFSDALADQRRNRHATALRKFKRNIAADPKHPMVDYCYAWGAYCAAEAGETDLAVVWFTNILEDYWGDYSHPQRKLTRNWLSKFKKVTDALEAQGQQGKDAAVKLQSVFDKLQEQVAVRVEDITAKEELNDDDRAYLRSNMQAISLLIVEGRLRMKRKG